MAGLFRRSGGPRRTVPPQAEAAGAAEVRLRKLPRSRRGAAGASLDAGAALETLAVDMAAGRAGGIGAAVGA